MSEKQSAILVERSRKRRTLRDELWERCFVLEEPSFDVPAGWVQIERSDTIDATRPDGTDYEVFESDEHAALAACDLAKAPGVAMHYAPTSGVWEPVSLDGLGTSEARWAQLDRAAIAINPEHEHACPMWVCIIPKWVAKEAGLCR